MEESSEKTLPIDIKKLKEFLYDTCVMIGDTVNDFFTELENRLEVEWGPQDPSSELEELKDLIRDTWMMISHAKIDFSNGVEHAGMDEGRVKGGKHFRELEERLEKKDLLPYKRM